MRRILKSKVTLILLAFVAGASINQYFRSNFHFTFEKQRGAIDHVDGLTKQLDKLFDKRLIPDPDKGFKIPKGVFGLGIARDFSISEREDSSFKYLTISSEALSPRDIQVEIARGMVSISGVVKKIQDEKTNQKFLKLKSLSRFSKSFNIPHGVNENGAIIESIGNSVVIKFPKLNS